LSNVIKLFATLTVIGASIMATAAPRPIPAPTPYPTPPQVVRATAQGVLEQCFKQRDLTYDCFIKFTDKDYQKQAPEYYDLISKLCGVGAIADPDKDDDNTIAKSNQDQITCYNHSLLYLNEWKSKPYADRHTAAFEAGIIEAAASSSRASACLRYKIGNDQLQKDHPEYFTQNLETACHDSQGNDLTGCSLGMKDVCSKLGLQDCKDVEDAITAQEGGGCGQRLEYHAAVETKALALTQKYLLLEGKRVSREARESATKQSVDDAAAKAAKSTK
jgi:hypothetical protein